MPTELLPIGVQMNILQNVVYAIPVTNVKITSGAVVQYSILFGGAFADAAANVQVKGGFIKSVLGATTIKLDRVKMKKSVLYNQVVSDGASYYWKLDETTGLVAKDSIGGKDGTIAGGVTLGQTGSNGNAVKFDGSTATGKILVPNGIALSPPLTFEMWFKTPLSSTPPSSIFTTPGPETITIGMYPGAPQCYLYIGGVSNYCRITANTDDNQWHQLAFVLPGGIVIQGYFDGQSYPVSPQLSAPFVASPAGQWEIGYTAVWGPPLSFNGLIDNIAIYRKALTPDQILSHYQAGI
jgi:hypothetical protein